MLRTMGNRPSPLALVRLSRRKFAMPTVARSASEWAGPWPLELGVGKRCCSSKIWFFPTDGKAGPRIEKTPVLRVHGQRITLRGPASCGNINLNWETDDWETRYVNGYPRGTCGQIGGVCG